jgi:FlaA1/EpsC-like NDP-sugar epimerase
VPYLIFTLSLPFLWWLSVALARGYDERIVGLGSDEFRRVFNAAVSLTAAIAIISYATRGDVARSYVLIALPCATALDLMARYALRKRLHRRRRSGAFMRRVIAVGHPDGVTDLITELRREPHHGLAVVGAPAPRERPSPRWRRCPSAAAWSGSRRPCRIWPRTPSPCWPAPS